MKRGFTLAEVGFSVGCSDSETRNFTGSVEGGKISERNLKPVQERNSRIIRYKWAFTLAEVLITLGIIGIVAALTIPTLIANTQGTGNRSKFKKTVSTINQAARMSLAKNDFSFADINKSCGFAKDYCTDDTLSNMDVNYDIHSICKILETSLKGYIYRAGYTNNPSNQLYNNTPELHVINDLFTSLDHFDKFGAYVLQDGTVIGISTGGQYGFDPDYTCSVKQGEVYNSNWINNHVSRRFLSPCFGFIDVNGPNGPNKEVACSNGVDTTTEVEKPCKVDTKDITDIFPIVFHDATVEPASNAAMYVLKTAK